MGHPKKPKKQYKMPRKTWDKTKIQDEEVTVKKYGLKNKKEIRRIENILRSKRKSARELLVMDTEKRKKKQKELIDNLAKIGVLKKDSTPEAVLGLEIQDFLERRLQTISWRKNLAKTPKQARQFIVHGHIAINGKKVDRPSYVVTTEEETKINYSGKKMELEPKKIEEEKKEQEEIKIIEESAHETKAEEKIEEKKENKTEDKKEAKGKAPEEKKKEITVESKKETKKKGDE